MPTKEDNRSVHGSVIQRSLIPEGLGAVLNVATVPIADLDSSYLLKDARNGFQRLVGQVVGMPAESILGDEQYRKLASMLREGSFWERTSMRGTLYAELMYKDWRRYFRDLIEESADETLAVAFPDRPAHLLGSHALSLMVSPTRYGGMQWPSVPPWLTSRGPRGLSQLGELEVTEEVLQLGMSCFFTAVSADERVMRFTRAAGRYDIPSGQSPAARSDSLTKLIETSKKVCLAPLAIGGTVAISQLSQGNYVAALLCTATGSGMTLILVGTVSVADYLVHYLLHRRNSIDNGDEKPQKQMK